MTLGFACELLSISNIKLTNCYISIDTNQLFSTKELLKQCTGFLSRTTMFLTRSTEPRGVAL